MFRALTFILAVSKKLSELDPGWSLWFGLEASFKYGLRMRKSVEEKSCEIYARLHENASTVV